MKTVIRFAPRNVRDLRKATEIFGLHENINIRQILNQAAISRTNEERLEIWKQRYKAATGIKPTDEKYTVLFCRACKRPIWFNINLSSTFLTARCPGH